MAWKRSTVRTRPGPPKFPPREFFVHPSKLENAYPSVWAERIEWIVFQQKSGTLIPDFCCSEERQYAFRRNALIEHYNTLDFSGIQIIVAVLIASMRFNIAEISAAQIFAIRSVIVRAPSGEALPLGIKLIGKVDIRPAIEQIP